MKNLSVASQFIDKYWNRVLPNYK